MDFGIQFFGVLGLLTTVMVYQQKENRKMLLWKIATDTAWVIHYCMLGAYSVAVVTVVAILRSTILLCQSHAWARSRIWLWVFLGSSLFLSILAWKDWTSLLTTVGSLACIIAYWIGIPRVTRLITLPAGTMFLINVALNGSLWGTICESFLLGSALIGIIRLDIRKKNPEEETGERVSNGTGSTQ